MFECVLYIMLAPKNSQKSQISVSVSALSFIFFMIMHVDLPESGSLTSRSRPFKYKKAIKKKKTKMPTSSNTNIFSMHFSPFVSLKTQPLIQNNFAFFHHSCSFYFPENFVFKNGMIEIKGLAFALFDLTYPPGTNKIIVRGG